MGPSFYETRAGRAFLEGTLPELVRAMKKIGEELQRANDLAEKRLKASGDAPVSEDPQAKG